MKHLKTNILMVAIGLAVAASPAIGAPGWSGNGGSQAKLTPAEAATLTYMREEEKLARDVYLYLFDMWGVQVFSTIAASEQQHMDALKKLLDKYGLPDPAGADGVFTNPHLQALYDELVAKGEESPLAALMVGGLIEEVDMVDLALAMDETSKEDLDRVYGNLMNGSENHLRAFAGRIVMLTGEDYEAQFLTQAEVDAILADVPKQRRVGNP